ncbi:hypothetical protein LTR16_009319, partial [Cryomyces antarcticus]
GARGRGSDASLRHSNPLCSLGLDYSGRRCSGRRCRHWRWCREPRDQPAPPGGGDACAGESEREFEESGEVLSQGRGQLRQVWEERS